MLRGARASQAEQNKAGRNTAIALLFLLLLVLLSAPAIGTVLKLGGLDKQVLFTVWLPGGGYILFQTFLFPYMSIFVLYKLQDAIRMFWKIFPEDFDTRPYEIFDNTFFIKCGYIRNWHVFIFFQTVDVFSDANVFGGMLMSAAMLAEYTVVWGLTTVASLVVPLVYLLGKINFKTALLLELVLEDLWQMGIAMQEIPKADLRGHEVPLLLISSGILAVLGVLSALGTLISYLRN